MTAAGHRPAPGVGVVVDDQEGLRIFLARLPDGPLVVLAGSSAVIWEAATASGEGEVVQRVARATGVSPDEIRDDVERFVGELVARGFLEAVGATTN